MLKTPAPVVGIASLGDSAIILALGPWVAVPDYAPAQGELYQAVVERFRAAGIEMPFPQREVRLHLGRLSPARRTLRAARRVKDARRNTHELSTAEGADGAGHGSELGDRARRREGALGAAGPPYVRRSTT